MHVDQLETPVAIVDVDKLQSNIARLQKHLDTHNILNRPHVKSHKIPDIARMQLEAGAIGVTCQKISEAEVMVQAGIQDIFIPYNIIGEKKLERLVALARHCRLSITADSSIVVHSLSHTFAQAGMSIPVLVECDTGLNRCGVQTPAEAVELARSIHRLPNLTFGGLMTYPSSVRANEFMREVREQLAREDIRVERRSGGSTGSMRQAGTFSEINEHRAGEYVYGDRHALWTQAMTVEECALKVIVTVVSRPTANRGIIDGGSKTFSSDRCELPGYGMILEYQDAHIYELSEEHGHVDFSRCQHKPAIGERLTIIPNHCCAVSNLFDQVIGISQDTIQVVWHVAGRGTIQ